MPVLIGESSKKKEEKLQLYPRASFASNKSANMYSLGQAKNTCPLRLKYLYKKKQPKQSNSRTPRRGVNRNRFDLQCIYSVLMIGHKFIYNLSVYVCERERTLSLHSNARIQQPALLMESLNRFLCPVSLWGRRSKARESANRFSAWKQILKRCKLYRRSANEQVLWQYNVQYSQ